MNTKAAFEWIIDLLDREKIAYKISGGLAARTWGSTRPLSDIDIDVNDKDVDKIVGLARDYVVEGPVRYIDNNWDLYIATLKYRSQEIDIAGITTAKIYDQHLGAWIDYNDDIDSGMVKEIYGRQVYVESLKNLIAYKSKIRREVDLEDVRQISDFLPLL